jgi:hypothetical protein
VTPKTIFRDWQLFISIGVGWSVVYANDTLHRDCRNAKPRPTNPISIMTHVVGSGTVVPVNENAR